MSGTGLIKSLSATLMNLVIDTGNTRTKIFLFSGEKMVYRRATEKLKPADLKKLFAKYRIGTSIHSSVISSNKSITSFLRKNSSFIELSGKTRLPFKNRYVTKQTLGKDRIANAAGAATLFPSQNCLVIDIGTCIKYDFINERNEYLGGAISPGMQMRYEALHRFTAKLPLVKPSARVKNIGATTRESITSGVQQGMLNEMEGFIQWYSGRYKKLKIILTGGDAVCFAHLFNFRIFAAPELTAIGLNGILQHNQPKK